MDIFEFFYYKQKKKISILKFPSDIRDVIALYYKKTYSSKDLLNKVTQLEQKKKKKIKENIYCFCDFFIMFILGLLAIISFIIIIGGIELHILFISNKNCNGFNDLNIGLILIILSLIILILLWNQLVWSIHTGSDVNICCCECCNCIEVGIDCNCLLMQRFKEFHRKFCVDSHVIQKVLLTVCVYVSLACCMIVIVDSGSPLNGCEFKNEYENILVWLKPILIINVVVECFWIILSCFVIYSFFSPFKLY